MSDTVRNQVAIIDYGMGNLFNVQRACDRAGLQSVITSDKGVIVQADGLILPGVGAFGDAMANLKKLDLTDVIKDHIGSKKPFFGVCLGMQLLLSGSEEFGGHKGLDVIKGRVVKFKTQDAQGRMVKVPQVGWNRIWYPPVPDCSAEGFPLQGIVSGEFMYFVHSYYAVPEDPGVVLTQTTYEDTAYCSSVLKDTIFAVQFHPEKSGREGLRIYKNWASCVNSYRECAK